MQEVVVIISWKQKQKGDYKINNEDIENYVLLINLSTDIKQKAHNYYESMELQDKAMKRPKQAH